MTKMVAYKFVGLSTPVYLPDDILVEIDIVPSSRTNVRSLQLFTGQYHTTWHDTGNNGSTADSERNWLHKHMPSTSYAGYNFAADGVARTVNGKKYRGKIIQLTPLNEITWAAGTALGNKVSFHIEQCFGGPNDWNASLYVTASLHGGLCAAKGWKVEDALVPHRKWYGKWCPAQILNRNIWDDVMAMVKIAAALARDAAQGPTPAPAPADVKDEYVNPVMIASLVEAAKQAIAPAFVDDEATKVRFYWVGGDKVKVIKSTPRRQYSTLDSPLVGPNLNVGQEFEVDWVFTAGDGNVWYLSKTWFTRVLAKDTVRVGRA